MTGTAASPATKLYTPSLLALCATLAEFPFDPGMPLIAEARSRTCGSAITLGLATGPSGAVTRIGMQVSACAIGQSSAAIMAQGIVGKDPAQLAATRAAIAGWLDLDGPLPDWPGLAVLAPSRAHRGRHGALVLAWDAAIEALSSRAPTS